MGKEVKNQVGKKKRLVKEDFEQYLLELLKKDMQPVEIATHLNMKLGHLSYYLSSLKQKNIIKKIGKVWEINPAMEVKLSSHKGSTQVGGIVKDKRGHAFIWKIKPNKSFNWEELLEESNVYSEPKGIADTPRIIINGCKIWLGKYYITIFEPEESSFIENTSFKAKAEAVIKMIDTIEMLKKALNIEFKYQFTCRRQHYGHLNNLIAKKFKKDNKVAMVKNEKGYWLRIDFSGKKWIETEFDGEVGENDSDIQSSQFDKYWNSQEKNGFKVDADFILNGFDKLIKKSESDMQLINKFGNELTRHIPAYEKLGKEVERINDVLSELSSVIKELRK